MKWLITGLGGTLAPHLARAAIAATHIHNLLAANPRQRSKMPHRAFGTVPVARCARLSTLIAPMKRTFRPFHSSLTRLLAGLLVAAALLINGMAVAMAAPVSMDPDCCAGMAGQHGDKAPCDESGKPCPPAGSDCDEQCLARCLGSTVVPSTAVSLPEFFQRQSAQLVLIARASSSPPPDPGLRPPIFA